jgi:hypothetical protein
MRIATILIAIPLFSVAAGTGRVERCNFDLRAPSRQIALHATEGLDTAIEASIRSDGTIPNLSGWRLLLWYGDAATNPPLGVAFTNITLSRGVARWDIPGAQIATNGRFTVQIVGQHTSGRSEEWARGWLAINRNSASSFSALTFGTPGWALATNVQAIAAAEAAARAAGDAVSLTNWQARVNALTNGAALGATALQPGATNGWTVGSHAGLLTPSWATTGTVAHAATAGRIAVAGDADYWLTVCGGTGTLWRVSDDTTRVYIVSASVDFNGPAVGTILTHLEGLYHQWGNGIWESLYYLGGWTLFDHDTGGTDYIWELQSVPFSLPQSLSFVEEHESLGSCVIDYVPVTNSYALATLADVAALPTFPALNASNNADRAYADAAVNAAPAWIGITNLAAAVTITNSFERPVYLYSTGTVAVAFSGLRTPMPLYLVLRGPDSLTFPGAYYVGGGSWQTNMSNHFVVWQYGTNLYVNPVTASED